MIDMSKFNGNSKDNSIVVNGSEYMVNDKTAEAIMNLIIGKVNLTMPKAVEQTEASEPKVQKKGEGVVSDNVACKWSVEEIKVGKKKFYRVKTGVFTCGKWNDGRIENGRQTEYRTTGNLEANKIANDMLKALEGCEAVRPDGENGWIAYGSYKKSVAEGFIEKLPEKIQGVQIDKFIADRGGRRFQRERFVRYKDTQEEIRRYKVQ